MRPESPTPQNAAPVPGGILVAAAVLAVFAVAHHPVVKARAAADVMRGIRELSAADQIVHGALIAVMVLLLFAFSAFAQRRDLRRPLDLFALIAFALGTAVMIGAGLVDGFFIPEIGRHFATPAELTAGIALLKLCAIAIQLFTKLGVIATCVATLAWSADLVTGSRAQRITAIVGFAAVVAQAAVLAFGGPAITAHTIVVLVAAQACWYVAVGSLLIRGADVAPRA